MGMEGSRATRRQLFDIALAGPIAGLVIALPFLAIGLFVSQADSRGPFALPLLARWLLGILRPDLPSGSLVAPNPLFMAGWVGLLVTGLNMLPISQLDGGHIVYSLIGPTSKWIGRSLLIAAILSVVVLGAYNWIVLIVIITLIGRRSSSNGRRPDATGFVSNNARNNFSVDPVSYVHARTLVVRLSRLTMNAQKMRSRSSF